MLLSMPPVRFDYGACWSIFLILLGTSSGSWAVVVPHASYIVEALKVNTSLTELDLRGNYFNTDTVKYSDAITATWGDRGGNLLLEAKSTLVGVRPASKDTSTTSADGAASGCAVTRVSVGHYLVSCGVGP